MSSWCQAIGRTALIRLPPRGRGLLYHQLLSRQAHEFVSKPAAVQVALQTVSQALAPLKEQKMVTWLPDSGFDDVAVWRTSWEQQEHVVLRIYHTERKVAFQDRQGEGHEGENAQTKAPPPLLGAVGKSLGVQRWTRQ